MSDALLSPAVGASFWAASLGAIALSAKRLNNALDDKSVPLMGVIGAFVFAVQMINFTIPATGSSGHLGGGLLLAITLGPHSAFIVMASVLSVQALFFADGGLLALGSNIFNLGFFPCFVAYPLIYKHLSKQGKNLSFAIILSATVGLLIGAFSVVLQTYFSGRSELPFGAFIAMMLPIHLVIGIVEGFVTLGVVSYIRKAYPGIIESLSLSVPTVQLNMKKLIITIMIMSLFAGGALSWFASAQPDGLEWSISKVYGKTELPEREDAISRSALELQNKTVVNASLGTSVSGIVGSMIVLGVVLIVSLGIRAVRKQ